MKTPELTPAISHTARQWLGKAAVCLSLGLAITAGEGLTEEVAAAEAAQATVGMPFSGQWAYNTLVNPDGNGNYSDATSSHPSVHHRYYGDWATDLYAPAGTPVKLHIDSSDGPVSFNYNRSHDTCSSVGPNIAGHGIVLNVLVNGQAIGSIDYEHLDNIPGVGTNFTNGMTIGTITRESLDASCYSARHTHVELLNNSKYACWTDHGRPGTSLPEGSPIGQLGSPNTGPQQVCASPPPATPLKEGIVAVEPTSSGARYMQADSQGNGQFAWNYSNLVGMTSPEGIELGDINADRKADIVAVEPTSSGSRYMVGMSHGDGTFGWNYSNLTGMTPPVDFKLGDVTGDKKADIIAFEPADGGGRYMIGTSNGNGNFSWNYTNLKGMTKPTDFALGDINGDGKDDIVAFEPTNPGGRYMVGTSNGDGNFNWNYSNLTGMTVPTEFAVADVTGDGKADIVAFEKTATNAGHFTQGTSNGNGSFTWNYTNLVNMQPPTHFELGDFTGDGRADLVDFEPNNGSHVSRYMQGSSQGTNNFNWGYTNLNDMTDPKDFAMGDFTG